MVDATRQDLPQSSVVVLGLNYAPETTGIAPYTTGIARHLAEHGYNPTVIAGYPHYPEWHRHPGYDGRRPPELECGVRLHRVWHPVPGDPSGPARVWMEVMFAWGAARRLVQHRAPVVIAISPALLSLVPALLLRRLLRFRVGAVVQDLYGAALAETGVAGGMLASATARLEYFLLRRMDGVVVIHEVFKSRLVRAGVDPHRITVIPNWAHIAIRGTDDRELVRHRLGWDKDDFIALHAGNMGAKQGLEGLLKVARLAEQRRSRVRVVLLGTGSERARLMAAAADTNAVTILDPLPEGEFEAALTAADCLLLHEKPGVVEMSVPSKLTSYFAAARPVVAATDQRSGAAALMAASGAGLTVRAGDPADILEAIEQLAESPRTAHTMAENARSYASQHLKGADSLRLYETWIQSLNASRGV
jgi:colanic acid biosynthesis glycosyl transferase WcaI